ncbi:hypothetical protein QCA50_016494 [Cerrena zonata]|uniref:Uncharacterized protein n=1 Tax=Cerrena zonata TaxID=2478898 RepID=A0AAW0FNA8_9APHY
MDSLNKAIQSNSENAPDSVKGTACGIDSDEEFYDAKSSPENKMKKENNKASTIPQVDFHDSSSSSFGRNDIDSKDLP